CFVSLRGCGRRGIMAPENLVGKAYALTADEHSRTGDQANSPLPLGLAAERALRTVPGDLVALCSASEDHPATTFSFSFSSLSAFALSFSPTLVGVRQRVALAVRSARQQHRGHRVRHTDADRRHGRTDVLHGVVDREPGCHLSARAVDVERDLLLRVL